MDVHVLFCVGGLLESNPKVTKMYFGLGMEEGNHTGCVRYQDKDRDWSQNNEGQCVSALSCSGTV